MGRFLFSRLSRKSFPDSSAGQESACNAGDPRSIPGSGRSAGEGSGCPLQYPWALLAQLGKNPPALWENWVGKISWRREWLPTPVFLGFVGSTGKESACSAGDLGSVSGLEHLLEKGRLPIPVFWPGESHGLWIVHRVAKSRTQTARLSLF